MNPAASSANRPRKAIPSLCQNNARAAASRARTGRRRCRVSGSRGAPSATASTRSAGLVSGGSRAGESGSSSVIASPQMTCRRSMALLRTTYRVRPATLTWLGAGSPSAAATKEGAAIDEADSTAQSWKKVRIRPPRLVLKILTTSPHHPPQLRVEFLRPQRGMEVAQAVLAEQGERLGGLAPGRAERVRAQLRPLDDPHPRQRGDPRAVTLAPGPEQGDHRLAVPGGQL